MNTQPKFYTQSIITTSNESIINNSIIANDFSQKVSNSLDQTNKKWFINLTDTDIPSNVSNLLQLRSNFSLPINNDKKLAIHEFIKNIESN